MQRSTNVIDQIAAARAAGEAFAIATVVRTVSLTAAKAGAKAIIKADGTISAGWIGGGCARTAVLNAAREALVDGKPRLISVQPPDALAEGRHFVGEIKDGTQYARNMCPSKGTMDIFIEPFLLQTELLIFGASPIAVALAELADRVGYRIVVIADEAEHWRFKSAHQLAASFDHWAPTAAERYIVVSTQGRGDEVSLRAALSIPSQYVAFVGSHRKADALKDALAAKGVDRSRCEDLHSPAGLDIGSVTPEEIAVSILAEITSVRRRGTRAIAERSGLETAE